MGFLGIILQWLAPNVIGSFLAPVEQIFQAYFNKQITEAELKAKVTEALIASFGQVTQSNNQALTQTFASFMATLQQSRMVRVVWSIAVLSQLTVLVWYQLGVPFLVYFGHGPFPSAGATVEWAYLLVAACLGLGPVILGSASPGGTGSLVDILKDLVSTPRARVERRLKAMDQQRHG